MKKNLAFLIALTIFFVGSSFINQPPAIAKVEQSQKMAWPDDEDEDGVPDLWDKCPHTPPLVPVDPDGCPIF